MKKTQLQYRKSIAKSARTYSIITVVITMLIIVYFLHDNGPPSNVIRNKTPKLRSLKVDEQVAFKGHKIVHLDLKGAPPKVSYYTTLFPLLKQMGATGILMEYEDMFPYSSSLNISANNCYSLQDIGIINELAIENDLEIIPLVQTFGHLEFLLKLEQYQDLREMQEYPQVICPTNVYTNNILLQMINEVLQAHANSKFIHIGSDEVYYLGYCDKCSNKMLRENWSKNQLFLKHVRSIASKIHEKYPSLRILMWDDEFRGFSAKELKDNADLDAIKDFVSPVVWKYSRDVYEELGPSLWNNYRQVFENVWVASAFKGATGSDQYVNDVNYYVQNHRSWLSLVSEYQSSINFEGIIITGWQRYDHFSILCELLPVSLPSLAMCLRIIQGKKDSPLSPPLEVATILNCDQPYGLIGPAFGTPKCSYAGAEILENVIRLHQLQTEFEGIMEDSRIKGWFSYYNQKHDFSNPQYVLSATVPLTRMMHEMIQIQSDITSAMIEIYDNHTIEEWRETYLEPLLGKMQKMIEARERIVKKRSWPKRPLLNPSSLDRNDL